MTNLVLTCDSCGQKNRVPVSRLTQHPRCGKCQKELRPFAPIDVDDATLTGLIQESPLPLLADFWAPWCGPCRMVAPVLEQVARRQAGHVLLVKVNTDEHPGPGARFRVTGIPTLILFDRGKEQHRLVGAHPQAAIERMLASYARPQGTAHPAAPPN